MIKEEIRETLRYNFPSNIIGGKVVLLFLFFLLLSASIMAQESSEGLGNNGYEPVEYRGFDSAKIEELKEDPDLQYGEDEESLSSILQSWYEAFREWLRDLINQLFSADIDGDTVNIIIYVIAIVLVLFSLYRILKMKGFNLFSRDKQKVQPSSVAYESVRNIDFEKEISRYVKKADYRMAIRQIYLFALQKMDDSGQIEWKPQKTEQDYLAEIELEVLKKTYERMAYIFDFIWYGHFDATEEILSRMRALLEEIDKYKLGKA